MSSLKTLNQQNDYVKLILSVMLEITPGHLSLFLIAVFIYSTEIDK